MAERQLETALVLTGRDASKAAFLSAKANAQGLMKSMRNLSAFGGVPSVSTAMGNLGRSMIGAGRAAKDLIANVAQIGGLAGILSVGALSAALAGVAQKLDDLDDAAKKIGISTQSLREFVFVAKLAGVNQETVVGGLTQATQAWAQARAGYGRTTAALKKLNPALLEQIKHAQTSGEAFNIMLSAIENASDEGTRNLLSQLFFASSEFAKIAADGAEANAKAMKRARELLGVITQSQVEGIKTFNDSVDMFKGSIEGVLSVTMAKIAPALTPFVEQMTALVVANREFIATAITQTVINVANAIKAIDWIAFGHSIEAIATAANHAAQWVGGWQNVMIGVAALPFADLALNLLKVASNVGVVGFSMAASVLSGRAYIAMLEGVSWIAGTVGGVLGGLTLPVVAIGAAMVAAGLAIWKYWEPLKVLFSGLATGLAEGLRPAFAAMQPVIDLLSPAVSAVGNAFSSLAGYVQPLVGWFRNILEPVKLSTAEFNALNEKGQALGRYLGTGLAPAVKAIAGAISGTFKTTFMEARAVVEGVETALQRLGSFDLTPIKTLATNVLAYFHFDLNTVGAGWVKALIAGAQSIPTDPMGALATVMLDYFKLDLYPVAKAWTAALWEGLEAGSAQLLVNVAGLTGDVTRWFKNIDFVAIGKGWIDGLIDGIKSAVGALMETVNRLASDIAAALNPAHWLNSTDNALTSEIARQRAAAPPPAGFPGRASGGNVRGGQYTWVGETGPELVRWGADGEVIPHSASMRMASVGSAAAGFNPEQRRLTDSMQRLTQVLTDLTNAIKFEAGPLGTSGGGGTGGGLARTFGDYGHHPGQGPRAAGGGAAGPRQDIPGGWKGANIGAVSKTSQGRAQQAMALLMADGWSRVQAAGMVGNLQHESMGFADSVISGKVRGDKGSAFGLGQWRGERQDDLRKWAAAQQRQVKDFATQVLFYSHEFRAKEAAAGKLLLTAKTVHQATDAALASERPRGFDRGVEHSLGHEERLAYAEKAAADYGKLLAEQKTVNFKPPINDAAGPRATAIPEPIGSARLDVHVRAAPGTQAGARLKTEGNLTGNVGRDGMGNPDWRPGVNSPIFGGQ